MNTLSQSIVKILNENVPLDSKVIEIGSATGHITIELANRRKDLHVTLNELRKITLYRSLIHAWSKKVYPSITCKNLIEQTSKKRFEFAWNSGLLQCIPNSQQERFIKRILSFSDELLLIYPDISVKKAKGFYKPVHQIIGVEGCTEYEVNTKIFNRFDIIKHGTIDEAQDIAGFPFNYALLKLK